MGQFLLRKKRKNLQQIEILNGNSVYLTHQCTEVFGSGLFPLLKKDSWQSMFEFLRASNYII